MHTCELLYDCVNSFKTSRCIGTRNQTQESFDCAFCSSVSGCQNCFASVNLRNKKYHIFNKPYSKEDYFKEIAKYNLGSYKTYQEVKKLAEEHWKKYPPKPRYDDFSVNSTGNYVFQSKNCKECYEVGFAEDCKFISMLCDLPIKDCYDVSFWGNNLTLAMNATWSERMLQICVFVRKPGLTCIAPNTASFQPAVQTTLAAWL